MLSPLFILGMYVPWILEARGQIYIKPSRFCSKNNSGRDKNVMNILQLSMIISINNLNPKNCKEKQNFSQSFCEISKKQIKMKSQNISWCPWYFLITTSLIFSLKFIQWNLFKKFPLRLVFSGKVKKIENNQNTFFLVSLIYGRITGTNQLQSYRNDEMYLRDL